MAVGAAYFYFDSGLADLNSEILAKNQAVNPNYQMFDPGKYLTNPQNQNTETSTASVR